MLEGYGHYYQDDLAAANECAERSIQLLLEHRAITFLPVAYTLSSRVSLALGQLPQARCALDEAQNFYETTKLKVGEGIVKIHLGRILVQEDPSQAAEAVQMILQGIEILEESKMRPYQVHGHLNLGETYAIAGQKDKALASLKKAREMCQEMGMDYYLARTEKALEKLKH